MTEVRWEQYPLVAQNALARNWLQRQAYLQLAPNTVDAYGRCLNDYLGFCASQNVQPEAVTRDLVALYVQDLAHRPNLKGANILSIESGRGLSNSTMQQRITVLRLFCDSLIEQQLRQDNPVGRGHYVPGRAFGGMRDRGLLPHYHKLPWLPSDAEWQNILRGLTEESLRNQVLLLLAYDGALRRQELITLEMSDFDFAYRQSSCPGDLVQDCSEHGPTSWPPTIYDPYAPTSSPDPPGPCPHGSAPDRPLRGSYLFADNDDLHSR